MAEVHIDIPGEISWFAGRGPRTVLGDCRHVSCDHRALTTIAWGPDNEHYTLVVCDVDEGCAGRCRGWTTEYPPPFSAERPKFRLGPFKSVTASDPTTEKA